MWKIRKWFERKSVSKKEYDEEKRQFEMAIGKPFIILKIELPEGFEDQRNPFLKLESDWEFLDEVKDLVKKNLLFKRETEETPSTDKVKASTKRTPQKSP
jgi:hypothetical protein